MTLESDCELREVYSIDDRGVFMQVVDRCVKVDATFSLACPASAKVLLSDYFVLLARYPGPTALWRFYLVISNLT